MSPDDGPDRPSSEDGSDLALDDSVLFEESDAETELAPDGARAADLPSESDAPPKLRQSFWRLVVVFNVAVFCLALGPMLIGFENRLRIGGGVLLVGVGALVYGLVRYRIATRREFADDAE